MPERTGARKSRRKKRLKQKAARMKEDYRLMKEGRIRAQQNKHAIRKRQNNLCRMYRQLATKIHNDGNPNHRVDSCLNTILSVGTGSSGKYDDDDFTDGA